MCNYCDSYYDKYDIPSLLFSVEDGGSSDGTVVFDAFVNVNEIPPSLIVTASYSDLDDDFDRVLIPIRYCPICGAAI